MEGELREVRQNTEEIMAPNIIWFLFLKYVIAPIGGVLFCLMEFCKRVEYRHYSRLPFWEGKVIIVFLHHNSWLDVILPLMIYFPWWFREFPRDFLSLIKDSWLSFTKIIRFMLDERIKLKVNKDDNVMFSKDIPITAADRRNLRRLAPLLRGYMFEVNRDSGGATDRANSLRFAIKVLNNGGRISTFAEGGMINKAQREKREGLLIYDIKTRQPILRKIQPGVGYLVQETGAKVVPVIPIGVDKFWPRWKIPFRFWHKITILVGEPLVFPPGTSAEKVTDELLKVALETYYEGQEK